MENTLSPASIARSFWQETIKPISLAAISAILIFSGQSYAHGDYFPKHGGVMNTGGEYSFEMLRSANEIIFFIEDHGDPVSTAGSKIDITVKRAEKETAFIGTAKPPNKVVAKGLKPMPGDRLTIKVDHPRVGVFFGRFTWVDP